MNKKWFFLVCLLVVHIFLLSRLSFTAWPEMISFPYLMNNGFKLYTEAVYVYPPLLVLFLSFFFKVAGFGVIAVKFISWSILIASDIVLFFLIKKITKKESLAFLFTFFYIVIQPFLEGNSIWLDTAIVPFLLLGSFMFLKKKYFWAGIFLSVSLLIKQIGIFFILGIGIYILWQERKSFFNYLKGLIIPLSFLIIYFLINQNFSDFFNWNFYFPLKFWGDYPGYIRLYLTKKELLLMILFLLPFTFFKLSDFLKNKNKYLKLLFLVIISIVAIFPRFSYLHFQVTLPFLILIFAFVFRNFNLKKILAGGVLAVFIIVSYFLLQEPQILKPDNRFLGSAETELAEKIKKYTKEKELIYLAGVHSGLYVLTNTLPPKPWLDNFGWYFEIPGIQENVIENWSKNPPKYIVWQKPQEGNWYDLGVYRPKKLSQWIFENYSLKAQLNDKTLLYLKK